MKKLLAALLLVGGMSLVAHADKPVAMAPADMKFAPVPNTTAQIANLWGDWHTGAHGVIAKFVAGEDHPLHQHTATFKLVVLSGNFMFGVEGEKPKAYGPGSYVMVPAGLKHVSGCDKSGPCSIFQEGDGAFDMKPVETASAAKKPAAKK
jgi:hypothetical protein